MQLKHYRPLGVSLFILLLFVIVACQVPTAPGTGAPATSTPASRWEAIQASGKLVVGTSADYAPFAYYTPNFLLTGFDIELMREIGTRLGIAVEFKDFAFEGLLDALTLNQFDAAIAALSVTPAREAQVDFTRIYYVGEDGVLAQPGSSVTNIRVAADMAGKVIGVQNGTVYAGWAERELVDTGLIAPEQLLRYGDIESAAADLRAGEIDLIMLDYVAATALAQERGLRAVGRGLARQSFAIAIHKGDGSVVAQLNAAIAQLQEEGYIAALVEQYLALEPEQVIEPPTPVPPTDTPFPIPTPSPTETPIPTATTTPEPPTPVPPTPTPACVDGMAFIQDLNYDDANMTAPPVLGPGQGFTKGWRVQNTGTCPWPATYSLAYIGGNTAGAQMGGQPVLVGRAVSVNETADLQVNLIAPAQPGVYQGIWQMFDAQGVPFGQRMWVGIQIPGPPTATPVPPPPGGNLSFSADRTTIRRGERVILNWNVTGVKAVYVYEQGSRWEDNGVAGQGGREVWPQYTTIYEMRVVKVDDNVEVRQIRIDVLDPIQPTPTWTPVPAVPVIYSFTANTNEPEAGSCVSLRWDVGGNIAYIKLVRNGQEIMNNAGQRQYNDCQSNPGQYSYTLEVSNGRNSQWASQYVNFRPGRQPR